MAADLFVCFVTVSLRRGNTSDAIEDGFRADAPRAVSAKYSQMRFLGVCAVAAMIRRWHSRDMCGADDPEPATSHWHTDALHSHGDLPAARTSDGSAACPDRGHDDHDDHGRGHDGDDQSAAHRHDSGSDHRAIRDHGDGHGHPYPAGSHDHGGRSGRWWHVLSHVARPHSHDVADRVDSALEASADGIRTLWISFGVLAVTTVVQVVVVVLSGSVALLGDTVHNFADALTALPIGVAFVLGRRGATRRYTYGFGRAEDLAGIAVLLVITGSAVFAAYEAINRLAHPRPVTHLPALVAAGLVGFVGNELVARYRIRTGRGIGSAALVADGLHARTDGFTSLAVVAGAIGVAAGWDAADPVVGLVITATILAVLRGAIAEIYRRLMDAVDPTLVDAAEA